jgi:ketosteroid isomerase-like protein
LVSELDDFRMNFLPRQARAEEALIQGDANPRIEMWSRHDPVTLFSAGGQNKSGWADVSQFFRWLASRFSNGSGFRFELEAAEVSGDLAYTVGFERYDVSVEGRSLKSTSIRVTQIYRREDDEWKIVHRHGDTPGSS